MPATYVLAPHDDGGYIPLPELEAVTIGPWVVERDLAWTPRRLG
jgi:hypothetical protein